MADGHLGGRQFVLGAVNPRTNSVHDTQPPRYTLDPPDTDSETNSSEEINLNTVDAAQTRKYINLLRAHLAELCISQVTSMFDSRPPSDVVAPSRPVGATPESTHERGYVRHESGKRCF